MFNCNLSILNSKHSTLEPIFAQTNNMIQRIQSVFLLLAAIAMAMLFFMPYVEVANDDYFAKEYIIQTIFAAIVVIGLVATIFLYNNRNLQLRLSRILLLFVLAFIAYAVYQLVQVNFQNLEFEPGGLLPVFTGYFTMRAASKIKADEDLVRSVDRLR